MGASVEGFLGGLVDDGSVCGSFGSYAAGGSVGSSIGELVH